jgi:hypothetical protein
LVPPESSTKAKDGDADGDDEDDDAADAADAETSGEAAAASASGGGSGRGGKRRRSDRRAKLKEQGERRQRMVIIAGVALVATIALSVGLIFAFRGRLAAQVAASASASAQTSHPDPAKTTAAAATDSPAATPSAGTDGASSPAVPADVREAANRVRCAKSLAALAQAQRAYRHQRTQPGRPVPALLGQEDADGVLPDIPFRATSTDASRGYVALFKRGFIADLAELACPSDPFVTPLSPDPASLKTEDADLHSGTLREGAAPAPDGRWRPGPGGTAAGRTFFSYSMQAGNAFWAANPGSEPQAPNQRHTLSPKFPLYAERNPWCEAYRPLAGGEAVTDKSPEGNSWNHDRRGGNVAFPGGEVTFLSDARAVSLSPSAIYGAPASGFSYIYSPDGLTKAPADRPGGSCVPPGKLARSVNFGVWMTD